MGPHPGAHDGCAYDQTRAQKTRIERDHLCLVNKVNRSSKHTSRNAFSSSLAY